jgi:L-ascorbate metabolism protein UlaG (beta-lactamase superfamily)
VARYTNLDGTTPDKDFGALLRWQIGDRLAGRRRKDPGGFVTPRRANDGRALASRDPSLTWIGHATYVQRLGGKLLATDPIWSERLGPRRRLAPPGVALADLPRLDIVTVSHSHYDHLDLPTLKRLGSDPEYIVPLDVGEILRGAGLTKVVELAWWQSHVVGDLRVTLVPAQHCGRHRLLRARLSRDRRALPEDRLGDAADRRLRPSVVHAGAAHGTRGGRARVRDPRGSRPFGHALGHLQADR